MGIPTRRIPSVEGLKAGLDEMQCDSFQRLCSGLESFYPERNHSGQNNLLGLILLRVHHNIKVILLGSLVSSVSSLMYYAVPASANANANGYAPSGSANLIARSWPSRPLSSDATNKHQQQAAATAIQHPRLHLVAEPHPAQRLTLDGAWLIWYCCRLRWRSLPMRAALGRNVNSRLAPLSS
ncbi:unnamed protein product [Tilletia controversa]|nr:unnamed protein product [Tilletia controversa]